MNKINHIIVALDISGASQKGLDAAITLAKLSDAKITCITVLVIYPTLVATVINYKKFMIGQAETMLKDKKKYCEHQKIQCTTKIAVGDPANQIIKCAEKHKADLIVIGSKGLGGIRGAIFGSVVNSVVHKSKVSVLVVK